MIEVLAEVRGRAGVITLNRPGAINSLTHAIVTRLAEVLGRWRDDDRVEVVVLTGAGERGLCAGGDVVALRDDALAGGTEGAAFWADEYTLNLAISRYPKPYVALMRGIVLGGGIGVSAHGSHRVVTEDTRVGMPETGIGFVPDVGGSHLLSRAGGLGLHLALSGQHLGPAEAIEAGLADVHVPSKDLDALVEQICDCGDPEVIESWAGQPEPALRADRGELDRVYGAASVEEILAGLDDLSPSDGGAPSDDGAHGDDGDGWALDAARRIRRNCPMSLAVTLAHLRRAADLDLAAALDAEYAVSVHMQRRHDFAEGVRAQVVDKDRKPHWQPATLAEVDPEEVAAVLGPLTETRVSPLHLAEDTATSAPDLGGKDTP